MLSADRLSRNLHFYPLPWSCHRCEDGVRICLYVDTKAENSRDGSMNRMLRAIWFRSLELLVFLVRFRCQKSCQAYFASTAWRLLVFPSVSPAKSLLIDGYTTSLRLAECTSLFRTLKSSQQAEAMGNTEFHGVPITVERYMPSYSIRIVITS